MPIRQLVKMTFVKLPRGSNPIGIVGVGEDDMIFSEQVLGYSSGRVVELGFGAGNKRGASVSDHP